MSQNVAGFISSWTAEILHQPPLIAPAQSFVYPQNIPGEEDALARGALHVLVQPEQGDRYLITCARGFTDSQMPTGVFACPNPDDLCALAGGYAYLASTKQPKDCTLLPLKPVTAVHALPQHGMLLFLGFQSILAWGIDGLMWQTGRLTWEGLRITSVNATELLGMGWDLITDREVAFSVDLATGFHSGSAFPSSRRSSVGGASS